MKIPVLKLVPSIANQDLSAEEHYGLQIPAFYAALLVESILILHDFFYHSELEERIKVLGIGLILLIYTYLLFWIVFPLSHRHTWLYWVSAVFNGLSISVFSLQTHVPLPVITTILVGVFVALYASVAGRGPVYLLILFSIGANGQLVKPSFPPTQEDLINIFSVTVLFLMIGEIVLRLSNALHRQMKRLEMINQVARKVATTIETPQLIALISSAIQEVLHADTYYIGLLSGESLRLELFYDDGEFFPITEIPVGEGLAGWVIKNRKSILLNNAPEELPRLGIQARIIGKPKHSLSWMGTPLEAGGHVLGIMAVASYKKAAFTQTDLELLESIAQQTALAIDNAYHHAEVEDQSHKDSLTQVYNHGYFLTRLNQAMEQAKANNTPLSLIMLDIDYFKQYNDHFGHLIGDQVLVEITGTIRRYIKKADLVGRWGGEEFIVLLVNANGGPAMLVAERIRRTLESITMTDLKGRQIPSPTVSQGIACFPQEAQDVMELIHMADKRLYIAKERGRNQVEPFGGEWGYSPERLHQELEEAESNFSEQDT